MKGAALAPLALAPFRCRPQGAAPGDKFDFVIAGAGHNSLVCAAYLAKGGFRVLVLEGRPTIGGQDGGSVSSGVQGGCARACTRNFQ